MRHLGIFLVCCFMTVFSARGELPTTGYVHEFFNTQCHNRDLDVPGAGGAHLTAEHFVLGIVDALNASNDTPSTYLTDTPTNNVVSLAWLSDQLPRLAESMTCCLGGAVELESGECRGCGTWLRESNTLCMENGRYRVGDDCVDCPAGFTCPPNTGGKILCGAGNWCADNVRTECDHGRNQCPYASHVEQPKTVACDDGYTFAYTVADKCVEFGKYRSGTECIDCPDGWVCPAGTNGRVICGAGYYCTASVRTPCAHGAAQCPDDHHTTDVGLPVACADVWSFAYVTATAGLCTEDKVYRSGTECAACPDGYWCPAGTAGKIRCGAGFWCAGGVRTPCVGGVTQCPEHYHAFQPTDDATTTE